MDLALKDHLDKKLSEIKIIYSETSSILEHLQDGEKILLKDLCAQVGNRLQPPKEQAELYPVIRLFLKDCPGIDIATGRAGGLYKGNRSGK